MRQEFTTKMTDFVADDEGFVQADYKSISKVLSPTERIKEQESKRTAVSSANKTTLLYRNVRRNPDIIFWGLALFLALTAGYCLARLKFGLTSEEVVLSFREFLEFFVAAFAALLFALAQLFAKAGPLVEQLRKKANKEDVDDYGRTIIQ